MMTARENLEEVMRAWREDRRPIEYRDLVALDAELEADQQAARVASIGRRYPDADPLPPSMWRERLGDLARALVFCSAGMVLGFAIVLVVTGGKA